MELTDAPRVVALIKQDNLPSRRVAESIGMQPGESIIKVYRGTEMPHIVYFFRREGRLAEQV